MKKPVIDLDSTALIATLRAACDEIAAMLPEKDNHVSADVSASRSYAQKVEAKVYVSSKLLGEYGGHFTGETFSEAFANARSGIRERLDSGRTARIRKMALAIIEATADHGECTDGRLRIAGFDAREIAALHAESADQANAMTNGHAGNYAVVFVDGANAAGA